MAVNMTSHELARKLLTLPDERVEIEMGRRKEKYYVEVKTAGLCECGAEILIIPDWKTYNELQYTKKVLKDDALYMHGAFFEYPDRVKKWKREAKGQ